MRYRIVVLQGMWYRKVVLEGKWYWNILIQGVCYRNILIEEAWNRNMAIEGVWYRNIVLEGKWYWNIPKPRQNHRKVLTVFLPIPSVFHHGGEITLGRPSQYLIHFFRICPNRNHVACSPIAH